MPTKIFMTAFEPYDVWSENSSWLALVEFTKRMQDEARIVTRRYPVDFDQVRKRLASDLAEGFDFALHLGQAPGSTRIQFESVGLNVGGSLSDAPENYRELVPGGPVAYRSELPLSEWVAELREASIPAAVSYHAGTYLCNATLYLSHYIAEQQQLGTQSTFIHLPLDASQTSQFNCEMASLPSSCCSEALHQVVASLIKRSRQHAAKLA